METRNQNSCATKSTRREGESFRCVKTTIKAKKVCLLLNEMTLMISFYWKTKRKIIKLHLEE